METVLSMSENLENLNDEQSERLDYDCIFSIKDLKAESFGNLLICRNEEEAIRACKIRLLYDQGSLMQQFPRDYMLYHIGYFNVRKGLIQSVGIPIPKQSLFEISMELEQEKKNRSFEIPEFMQEKGENNAVGSEKSESVDDFKDCGQSA